MMLCKGRLKTGIRGFQTAFFVRQPFNADARKWFLPMLC